MSGAEFRAAILVVSTSAYEDPTTDKAVPVLKEVFDSEAVGKWEVSDVKIVSDEVLDIQRSITEWADAEDPVNLIITTGGTGFSIRDVTPEVCVFGPSPRTSTDVHVGCNTSSGQECTWICACYASIRITDYTM
jgi:hypothetical protein